LLHSFFVYENYREFSSTPHTFGLQNIERQCLPPAQIDSHCDLLIRAKYFG
jgi:hypothetical protein